MSMSGIDLQLGNNALLRGEIKYCLRHAPVVYDYLFPPRIDGSPIYLCIYSYSSRTRISYENLFCPPVYMRAYNRSSPRFSPLLSFRFFVPAFSGSACMTYPHLAREGKGSPGGIQVSSSVLERSAIVVNYE